MAKEKEKIKMTMPYERRHAVNRTREFLVELLRDESASQKVRDEAGRCLRHYPGQYHMDLAREQAPDLFGDWGDFCVGGKPGKNEQAPEPFGDGDWDASIIHSDG